MGLKPIWREVRLGSAYGLGTPLYRCPTCAALVLADDCEKHEGSHPQRHLRERGLT